MHDHLPSRSLRYLALARDYEAAARSLYDSAPSAAEGPAFFHLVAHGLELALKAVIAAGLASEERLMSIGHDLAFCLAMARERGLRLQGLDEDMVTAAIVALAPSHHAQAFRYPGLLDWPPPSAASALHALSGVVGAAAVGASTSAQS